MNSICVFCGSSPYSNSKYFTTAKQLAQLLVKNKISLVYGGTRHEYLKEIISHEVRAGVWLVGFLGIIFLIVCWATAYV